MFIEDSEEDSEEEYIERDEEYELWTQSQYGNKTIFNSKDEDEDEDDEI